MKSTGLAGRGMQRLSAAEQQAKQTVRTLGRKFFRRSTSLTRKERKKLREAMALLRRAEKIDDDEIAVRLADRGIV